jgi:hypothetical protein
MGMNMGGNVGILPIMPFQGGTSTPAGPRAPTQTLQEILAGRMRDVPSPPQPQNQGNQFAMAVEQANILNKILDALLSQNAHMMKKDDWVRVQQHLPGVRGPLFPNPSGMF